VNIRANLCRGHRSRLGQHRRGNIVVLTAVLLVVIVGMIAFAVDIGVVAVTRTELQSATDAASLAGAAGLCTSQGQAEVEAKSFFAQNHAAGGNLSEAELAVECGIWDATTRTFAPSAVHPNAVRVTGTKANQATFFGRVFNTNTYDAQAQSVATFQPRDISIVLDYSGSMSFDSQFRSIPLLGRTAIEANLRQIYQELGSPTYGTLTFAPVAYGNSSTHPLMIQWRFGLLNKPYPYPGGSWDEFIRHVQTDPFVQAAGYQNRYGYMTWLHYLLVRRQAHTETPSLYATSQQPVTALKDAVDVFLDYLTTHSANDRVSLAIYSYSDNTAVLEHGLTGNFAAVSNTCRSRQAGHYVGGTNISAGMEKGRVELENNGRTNSAKCMVLMTDGVVTLPTGKSSADKNLVIQEAHKCAASKIPVITIALGALADTALMQEVADITQGAAFVVPGGQPVAAVKAQLEEVFKQVAADRPLKLVQ
jgi:Flp pilus assembly protein TadG